MKLKSYIAAILIGDLEVNEDRFGRCLLQDTQFAGQL
jgi:hypothetical protein